jgi:hypothetical protein
MRGGSWCGTRRSALQCAVSCWARIRMCFAAESVPRSKACIFPSAAKWSPPVRGGDWFDRRSVVLLAVGIDSENSVSVDAPVAAADPIPDAAVVEGELLPSFVVPEQVGTQSSIRLTDYIVQHNQFTPAIRRASINSSVAGEQHYWRPVPQDQPED